MTAVQAGARWVVVAAAVTALTGCGGTAAPSWTGSGPSAVAQPSASVAAGPVVAKVGDVFGGGRVFGVTTADPSAAGVEKVGDDIGCRPTLLQLFASVDKGISVGTLQKVSGVPVLSVEPWTTGAGADQPDWTLAATIEGRWDDRYATIARAVVAYREPVLIRYGHEMNGHWYPWGTANGNRQGEYVKAWKHVVDLFRTVGATNALWVWSPNILRGADNRPLKDFWPGDRYVDVVGLTGYGVRETSPNTTFRATLKQIYDLTDKPVLLTEVGAQPGPQKRSWLKAFGPWLLDTPRVEGFIWNQVTRDGDWRYNDTASNLSAFKSGLSKVEMRC
jgi:hypothetical protein